MNTNINLAFSNCKKEKRPALITYTVAGDNSKTNSLKILNSISKISCVKEHSIRTSIERTIASIER